MTNPMAPLSFGFLVVNTSWTASKNTQGSRFMIGPYYQDSKLSKASREVRGGFRPRNDQKGSTSIAKNFTPSRIINERNCPYGVVHQS